MQKSIQIVQKQISQGGETITTLAIAQLLRILDIHKSAFTVGWVLSLYS